MLLRDEKVEAFSFEMLKCFWKKAHLPVERLPDIFAILSYYDEEPELALILIHEKYPDLLDPESPFIQNYQNARKAKFGRFSEAISKYVVGKTLVDIGGGDPQLATAIVKADCSIEKAFVTDPLPSTLPSHHPQVKFLIQENLDSTPFEPESVDTVTLSTVLHHIDPPVRRSLLAHVYSILKPGGRMILMEDSFPQSRYTPTRPSSLQLEKQFDSLSRKQKIQTLSFLDWWGNRLMKNNPEIPLPCTFKSIEGWIGLIEDYRFETVAHEYLGILPISTHMMPPKAILVFEKPASSSSNDDPLFTLERVRGDQVACGILPREGLNINVSIGGTKLLTNLVNNQGEVIWKSPLCLWREEKEQLEDPAPAREWITKKITDQALAAIEVANTLQKADSIEGVGISWAGTVSNDGRVMGPNIDGFRLEDLSPEELEKGGACLSSALSEYLPDNYPLTIINDADEEGYANFTSRGIDHGTLLIIGSGIGAGFVQNKKIYFGPDDFQERLGEIGHHLIFDQEANRYKYKGLDTKGKILTTSDENSFTHRLSGKGIARRFLKLLYSEKEKDLQAITAYFPPDEALQKMLLDFYLENRWSAQLEVETLLTITQKAYAQDHTALRFLSLTGFEVGNAVGEFLKYHENELFAKNIHITGSVGKNLGKNVLSQEGKDLFLTQIEKGINNARR